MYFFDLVELIESRSPTWPLEWQEQFGRNDFFYVVGLREFFVDQKIAATKNIIAALAEFKDIAPSALPTEWLSVFPSAEPLERNPSLDFWNLEKIGDGIFRRAAEVKPMSFAKAMLILVCFHKYCENLGLSKSEVPRLEIRMANAYVPYLNRYFRKLSEEEEFILGLELGGEKSASPLTELEVGFPVTYRFAEMVADAIRNSSQIDETIRSRISVSHYGSRTDIRDTILHNYPDAGQDLMRVASGEQPAL